MIHRQVNQATIELIKQFEGFSTKPYKDTSGLWTIGYGHLIKPTEQYTAITELEARNLLAQDLYQAETQVQASVQVPLFDNQYGALVSFTYNLGGGSLKSSTLLKLLNNHQYDKVPEQLRRWSMDAGKVQAGLVRRREAEIKLWLQY